MGWSVKGVGGEQAFDLINDDGRSVRFTSEADSHAAGEAVRGFLGRPRVSEVIAQKQAAELERDTMRAERDAIRKASELTAEQARNLVADYEAQKFGIEKLAVSEALMKEKTKTARLEQELEALRLGRRDDGERHQQELDRLTARVESLEAEATELAGKAPTNEAPPS